MNSSFLQQRSLYSTTVSDRFGFVDNAKAIGIILVVLGHSRGLPDYVARVIFSFHVPLFFFLSGFLLKASKLNATVFSNVKQTVRTLGVPYVFFFLFAFLYWIATRNIGEKGVLFSGRAWYEPVAGLFTGLEPDLYIDPPLWFFPCLILTAIMYQASRKFMTLLASTGLFAVLAFVVTMIWKYLPYRLPLGMDSMWIALSFYAIGQFVRDKMQFENRAVIYLLLIFSLSSTLLIYTGSFNDKVDLANMYFGMRPAFYLLTSLLGIIATFSVSGLLPACGISRWLSANTLVIFPAHFVFLGVVRGMATSLHVIPKNYNYALGWSIVSTVLAILLCIPLAYFFRRFLARMYGNG
ncbi:Xanthan biosynthesis acetyltransferase GumF [Collimonas arenae]|uniref:Xanthan biosynthesis acetyltransferase GumF n=1 Tax=Collimonas arenae TaxID=279058 RepID=A0A0A1FEJ4_9BURK|nr:acyltransferase family protein [Collimonas arenae]AIY42089.1 Xanthan biosynthesis acetyltransferase GumF [Collimonas arenae]